MQVALTRLLGILLLCNSANLSADPQSKAFSLWYIDNVHATVIYSIALTEASRIPGFQSTSQSKKKMLQHLAETIEVQQGGTPCPLIESDVIPAKPGYLRVQMRFECAATMQQPSITIGALFPYHENHVHFATFKIDDRPALEYLYSRGHVTQQIGTSDDNQQRLQARAGGQVFTSYILLGFEHILAGIDHIAFLLALLLMTSRVREVLLIVTGFTLGHSITLSLAVLQLVTPDPMAVEALIGFSIALVATENVAARTGTSAQASIAAALFCVGLALVAAINHRGPPIASLLGLALFSLCYLNLANNQTRALQLRPAITTLFGLVHGFGFAGVLMEVGLPWQSALPALLGFNIGVELGQLAIVILIALSGFVAARLLRPTGRVLAGEVLSAGLCGLGVFWLVQRGFYS